MVAAAGYAQATGHRMVVALPSSSASPSCSFPCDTWHDRRAGADPGADPGAADPDSDPDPDSVIKGKQPSPLVRRAPALTVASAPASSGLDLLYDLPASNATSDTNNATMTTPMNNDPPLTSELDDHHNDHDSNDDANDDDHHHHHNHLHPLPPFPVRGRLLPDDEGELELIWNEILSSAVNTSADEETEPDSNSDTNSDSDSDLNSESDGGLSEQDSDDTLSSPPFPPPPLTKSKSKSKSKPKRYAVALKQDDTLRQCTFPHSPPSPPPPLFLPSLLLILSTFSLAVRMGG